MIEIWEVNPVEHVFLMRGELGDYDVGDSLGFYTTAMKWTFALPQLGPRACGPG